MSTVEKNTGQSYKKLCVLILFTISGIMLSAQYRDLKFVHITTAEGLSNSEVFSIVQDNKGFIWFGTADGINKYDGNSIKVYKHNEEDKYSLRNNYIYRVYKDSRNNLWFGTSGGISLYNRNLDNFINYVFENDSAGNKISLNRIRGIAEDNNSNLYVASERGKIYKFDAIKKTFTKQAEIKSPIVVFIIAIDGNNNIWLGTLNGLVFYNTLTKKFTEYNKKGKTNFYIEEVIWALLAEKNKLWIGTIGAGLKVADISDGKIIQYEFKNESNSKIYCLYKGPSGNIWIGDDNGLKLLDKNNNMPWSYNPNPNDKYSLLTPGVRSVLEDNQGNIFVTSSFGGINIAYAEKAFLHIRQNVDLPSNLTRNIISSVYEDEDGNLWAGSFNSGIDVINLKTKTKKHFENNPRNPYSLAPTTIHTIFEDSKKNIWIGSWRGGLQRYDKATGRFISCVNTILYPEFLFGDIRSVAEDKQGFLWLITHGSGAAKYNPVTKELQHFQSKEENMPYCFPDNYGFAFYIDRDDQLWAAVPSGLGKISYNGFTRKLYRYELGNIHSLSNNIVRCIYEDSRRNFWVGTDEGLNLFNRSTEKFFRIYEKNGLTNNAIKSILEDNSGNIWVSTNKGLSRITVFKSSDSIQCKIKNFDVFDGLQGDEFFERSAYKSKKTGQLFFGGTNGITAFYPDSITDNPYIPPVVFTDFKLFYQSVPVGTEKSPLKNHISETDYIELSHTQNVITIEFTALNYVIPEKNQFAYFLEGFDKGWNYVGNAHKATYTNLSPGNYTFRVKASNNDGIWNEKGIALRIHIISPFWLTGWAIAMYILIIAGILYYIYTLIVAKEKIKSETYIERLEAKKTHEIDMMKLQFFTNISHELRSPLTLILGPLQKLIKEERGDIQQQNKYNLIYRNAQRLSRLINQLLDFRKIEAGFMKLEITNEDIIRFVKVLAEAYNYLASQRNIKYFIHSSVDSLQAWFDPDKVDKILNNLLSNAFKYSLDGSEINIYLSVDQYNKEEENQDLYFIIRVADTGIGISKESISKLFTLFYQANGNRPSVPESTGIGLALTKELIDIHKGFITVNSELGKGSTFTVYLPFEKNKYNNNEVTEKNVDYEEKIAAIEIEPLINEQIKDRIIDNSNFPLTLIVEDNDDVRKFIKDTLSGSFRLLEAKDGEEGYLKAVSEIPDIIISDVIMPIIDGITLCSRLKNDFRTSHVPIILLTAKQSEESKIKGYETGADDYIVKPFDPDLLLVRVKNIVNARIKLKEIYSKITGYEPGLVNLNYRDKLFIDKAVKIAESHISDISFDSNVFASEMGMSRIQLYRKFDALTKQNVFEFVRNIRFKKAADMLLSSDKTVSEIAFAVGYTEPTNFIRAFAKHFGVTPSKYSANRKVKNNSIA